jgi:hypothetical protein
MSGPGDIDGEVSGDEAAWRDLIARFDASADPAAEAVPWPDREDLPDQATATADTVIAKDQPGGLPSGGFRPADFIPVERARVIRSAGDPRSYSPPEEEDEPYVPVPLPPPARLDPVAKAAWTGLIGGPGYLLIGTFMHWTIPGLAAFAAVAAFIAGFVTLVIRLSDQRRDDDDDGAVL